MRDQSFGVIPIRRYRGRYLFLLVQHHAGHWAFPKGHAEKGESDIDAARRELREETGIMQVTLLEDVSLTETYFFKRQGETVAKTVRYFLGLVRTRNVRIQAAEIKAYCWAGYEKAMQLITFPESRRLLTEINTYLQQNRAKVDRLYDEIGAKKQPA
jgi:8-oxo-dGTP pyrophosphatase MutT (NUDIX family)